MKTDFELDKSFVASEPKGIKIIGREPQNKVYVMIYDNNDNSCAYIKDKHLELLAVNILKALKSKRLNQQ